MSIRFFFDYRLIEMIFMEQGSSHLCERKDGLSTARLCD